jgi:hypothetical protein
MNDESQDQDLRSRFQAVRREDQQCSPPFAELVVAADRRGAPRRRRLWAIPVGLATAAGAVFGLWLLGERGVPTQAAPLAIDLSATRWTAPTDFLLELPGNVLLRTTPVFETGEALLPRDGVELNPSLRTPEPRNQS